MAKFVPRQRKQKHRNLARNKKRQDATSQEEDLPNAEEILPEHVREKEERKARMREELVQSQGIKVSGKKSKRLDKYIDNKLKKDETRELLAKLAETQVDTSLFTSSRALGHNRETKREGLIRAMREKKAGIDSEANDELLFEHRRSTVDDSSDESEHDKVVEAALVKPSSKASNVLGQSNDVTVDTEIEAKSSNTTVSIGAGLKRPLDLGDDGRPKLAKRQKRGGVKSKVSLAPLPPSPTNRDDTVSDDEWGGLSSDEMKTDSEDDESAAGDENDDEGSEADSNSNEGSENDDTGEEEGELQWLRWARCVPKQDEVEILNFLVESNPGRRYR